MRIPLIPGIEIKQICFSQYLDKVTVEEELSRLKNRETKIGKIEFLMEFWKFFMERYDECLKELYEENRT
ncbi:hypothetical protein CW713_03005 [Methanophagales archaeon]|nr:MAG: hypothetical protein CW713_03005 [Methanophagales archaeon]